MLLSQTFPMAFPPHSRTEEDADGRGRRRTLFYNLPTLGCIIVRVEEGEDDDDEEAEMSMASSASASVAVPVSVGCCMHAVACCLLDVLVSSWDMFYTQYVHFCGQQLVLPPPPPSFSLPQLLTLVHT